MWNVAEPKITTSPRSRSESRSESSLSQQLLLLDDELRRTYLPDLSLQVLVDVPQVPHGQLVLCAHGDPLHVDLVGQELVLPPQIFTFLQRHQQ